MDYQHLDFNVKEDLKKSSFLPPTTNNTTICTKYELYTCKLIYPDFGNLFAK